MTEQWRPCPGHEGLYEVSDEGRVRSLHFSPPKLLKFGKDETGYPTVMLSSGGSIKAGGTRKPFTVHRLVARAFHGDKQNVLHREVAHLDNDRTNARAENLKWVSRTENESHKYRFGTRASHLYSPLTEEQVGEIKAMLGRKTNVAIARDYPVSPHAISKIKRGIHWKHVEPKRLDP
jgi:hypothetical protein